jgi:glycosyltransferase involved in cell wall biosynthesis
MNQEQPNIIDGKPVIPIRLALLACRSCFLDYGLFLQRLLVGLSDLSIPVVLVCPPDVNIDSVMLPGVEIIRHPLIALPFLGNFNLKILIEKLRQFNPSVLHCLSPADAPLATVLSTHLNIPYLLTVNSLQKKFSSLSIERLASIIVHSPAVARSIAGIYPDLSGRITQVNMGTFISDFTVCFNRPERLASILIACPCREKADYSKLFTALKQLLVEGYDFIVAVIGVQQADWYLRKAISSLGLSTNVVIVPRLEPLRDVLSAADIFIQPCPKSSFNAAVLEAMSIGAAVAVCRGGVDDLVIDGQSGFVFDGNDQVSIFNCVKKMLDCPDMTRKIAKQAQNYLKENYSVSMMIDQTLQCYRQALSQHEA